MRRLGSSRGDEVGVSGCRRCLRSEMAGGMGSQVDVLGFVVKKSSTFRPVNFISKRVFMKSFRKSQFPHKSVNLSFTITNQTIKLTVLWGC